MSPLPAKRLAAALEKWFAVNQRDLPWRRSYDPFHVWVSEVMLQQTRMEVVIPYFLRFIERFPSVGALASASLDEVTSAWSGLGYYRRARMLHEGTRRVIALGGTIPSKLENLRQIPGIGRYTAGAIASIAFNQRAAIVDGNVARVVSRIATLDAGASTTPFERETWSLAEALVAESSSPRALNQSLMELGATICTPRKPACDACPVARYCAAFAARDVEGYPRPAPRKATVELEVPLFVVRDGSRFLLERHEGRLMGGMFHLPHGSAALTSDSSHRFAIRGELGRFSHTITNRKVTFRVVEAEAQRRIAESATESLWVSSAELSSYPHPSYVAKAIAIAIRTGRSS